MLGTLVTALELGLIYTPVVLGVYFTFRILRFPDMTTEGSFVCGAALSAVLITNGVDGYLALIIGAIAGGVAGLITGILHSYFGVNKILSGVITLGMLYSINIHIMNGSNVSLIKSVNTITTFQMPMNHLMIIGFLLLIVVALVIVNSWFLRTGVGLELRATGDNEHTASSLSIDIRKIKTLGIIIGNALAGLSGSLLAQYQGFSDVGMGSGVLVVVLAALMLGEGIFKKSNILAVMLSLFAGSVIYQIIINIALQLGMPSIDLKLISALLVVGIVLISRTNERAIL